MKHRISKTDKVIETQDCSACNGFGLWAIGSQSPMGPVDASDGMPTIPCSKCGANANPTSGLKEGENYGAHPESPIFKDLRSSQIRKFETGATRDQDETKLDYEGFLSPLALEAYANYMHKHRHQADGVLRDSDNWQKGIPLKAYMSSGFRHFMDWWKLHRGYTARETLVDALCGVLFNVQGYLHEILKNK